MVDLVWLRIIAATAPALYRCVEEYLTAYAALAADRVHISKAERTALTKRMDDALVAEGLNWKPMQFELERQPRLSLPQKAVRTEKMFEALQIRLEQEPRYQSAIGMELRRLVLNRVVKIVRDLS